MIPFKCGRDYWPHTVNSQFTIKMIFFVSFGVQCSVWEKCVVVVSAGTGR